MTRNLKTLLVAAMAVGAFASFATAGAGAAEFHCSVEPCKITAKPDGTGKTAHTVFVISNYGTTESASTTCNGVSGEGTLSSKTSTEISIGNIVGETCSLNGVPGAVLVSNGCAYVFKAASGGTMFISCPEGKEFENHGLGSNCSYNFGSQGPLTGVSFHNVGTEITVTVNVTGIAVKLQGECGINPEQQLTASITTGHFLFTGETDPGGVMANLWWE